MIIIIVSGIALLASYSEVIATLSRLIEVLLKPRQHLLHPGKLWKKDQLQWFVFLFFYSIEALLIRIWMETEVLAPYPFWFTRY